MMMEPERVDGAELPVERGGEAEARCWSAVRYDCASMSELVPTEGVGSCRSDFFDIFDRFSQLGSMAWLRLLSREAVCGRAESGLPRGESGRIEWDRNGQE